MKQINSIKIIKKKKQILSSISMNLIMKRF